jgi:hypothetical protein
MQLIQVPAIYEKIPDGDDLRYDIRELLPEAQFVSRLIGELPTLRIIFYRLLALSERSGRENKNSISQEKVAEQAATLRSRLASIQAEMGDHLYPFEHAQADTTLQMYALPQIPAEHDITSLVEVTEHLQSRLVTIQLRLFARLAQIAEKVELLIGLPPFPELIEQTE